MVNVISMLPESYLLNDLIALLRTSGIHAFVLNSSGEVLEAEGSTLPQLPVSESVRFELEENVGSLLLTASDRQTIDAALPATRITVKAISCVIAREVEFFSMSEEVIGLSDQINFLFALSSKILGVRSLHDLCSVILEEVARKVGAHEAFIRVATAHKKYVTATHNITPADVNRLVESPDFDMVRLRRMTILTNPKGEKSRIITPISSKDGVMGYLACYRNSNTRFFTAYEKKFVSIINDILSATIETLRLYDSMQDLYLNTIKALAAAIDAKDPYTHGHSFRVARYSTEIARKLGMDHDELSKVQIAAYMHDLGKIGISEGVLMKKGKLDDDEFSEIKKHPYYTAKILEPIQLPSFVTDAAVQHHERIDGTGYPYGLKGEEISIYARIITVADKFDAMTSERPYREALSVERAMRIITDEVDKAVDRKVVLALIDVLKEGYSPDMRTDDNPYFENLVFEDLVALNDFLHEVTRILIVPAP